jgi:serine/threonine protein kinase/tetratricopeptide (TPR) repeat protein
MPGPDSLDLSLKDRERWRAANELFHAALEISIDHRLNFVSAACKGDTSLEFEVCRLLRADQQAEGYLESPLALDPLSTGGNQPPAPFEGGVLKDRFQLVRHVGEGGMGHVYEAYDLELRVRVALKVIRSEIADNPSVLELFRREVRTARAITHANICRTFDLDRGKVTSGPQTGCEVTFLTMEFLAGITLAAHIKLSSPCPPAETIAVARQIALGLDAAHKVGIIHQDIKPSNIMLVPPVNAGQPSRVVITDFGLARRNSLQQSAVSSIADGKGVAGTLAYMAPEQLERDGEVSPATDVYAFGLVLYEMITGQTAFPSIHLLTGIARRLRGEVPSVREVRPEVDLLAEQAIAKCLAPRPEDRWITASAVVDAMEGKPGALSSANTSAVAPRIRSRSYKRTSAMSASGIRIGSAILILAVLSLFVMWLRLKQQTNSPVPPRTLVYLTPVINRTGESDFGHFTEMLRASLSQSPQVDWLDEACVGDTLQLMNRAPDTKIDDQVAREIAMRTGAARVVRAELSRAGGQYQLKVQIEQPDNTPLHDRASWHNAFAWRAPQSGAYDAAAIPAGLSQAVRDAADWIRHQLGESSNDIARLDAPPEDVTTASWPALEAYSQAEELNRAHRTEDALIALRNAVAADPEFALAYGRLGDLEVSLGRTADGYAAYERALDSSLDRRLTRRELDRIRGIYASDSWDYSTAEEAFRDYAVFYPNDFRGWFYRGLPLIRLGRYEEAAATLQRADQLMPQNVFAPYDLGLCALERGDKTAAGQWVKALRDRGYPEGSLKLGGITALLSGDILSARQEFVKMTSTSVSRLRLEAHGLLSRMWAELGNVEHALEEARLGEAEAASEGNQAEKAQFALDEASLLCEQSDWTGCVTKLHQGITLDNSPGLLLEAGEVAGQAIRRVPVSVQAQMRAELDRTLERVPAAADNRAYELAAIRLKAEKLAAAGDVGAAVRAAERAATLDQQFRRREQLVRLLLMETAESSGPDKRHISRNEIRELLAVSALHPETVWLQPELYLPGAWSKDLALYESEFAHQTLDDADLVLAQKLRRTLQFVAPRPRP